ncbi:MAG: DUF167 domain-containing protein [Patescibacteria group bacterium]|nr:DUF167 domain-containing protein [Patescibacteria group bacterium]MDD5554146.1 DUF167 domain-containing protein [Patescibacteria group bacterium]
MLAGFRKKLEAEGVLYLKVKARPGAAETKIKEIMADKTIKIDVAAPADKGKANSELIKFLAEEFGAKAGNVKIARGEKEKIKLIKIDKKI